MNRAATIIYIIGILGLFRLNRESEAKTSKALWIPVVWFLLAGSRAVSQWLQLGPPLGANQYLEGSPLDRNVYLVLLTLGLIVLIGRGTIVLGVLRENLPLVVFLLFCALSITWSDFPFVALKRWIKFLSDLVMVLIVLTDSQPSMAIKRLLARVGYVLLPISILFIKYYPELGRTYASHWEGTQFFTGVATDKNMLGMTCVVFGVGAWWRFLEEFMNARRSRILLANGTVAAMAVWLLITCNSMTSMLCLVLACTVMTVVDFFRLERSRVLLHVLIAAVILVCTAPIFLGFGGGLLNAVGRESTLTGRTDLWALLVDMTVNPIVGAGFESFWLGPRLEKIWEVFFWGPIEAHNGYLEIYLNLGWTGIVLLAGVIFAGYRHVVKTLKSDRAIGWLGLGYFVVGVAYNVTEAAFHTLSLVWLFFLLGILLIPKTSEAQEPEPATSPSRSFFQLNRRPAKQLDEMVADPVLPGTEFKP